MNILPLVFTFLIIFLCIVSTSLKEVKSFFLAETTLSSFNCVERKINCAIASKAYRKIKRDPISKKEKNSKKTKNNEYFSRRSFFPPFENSKFNIAPLIKYEADVKSHPLFEPLATLLRLLYKETVFDREPRSEKIEYRLLEALITKARKQPKNDELAEIFPEDPSLKSAYYKMLKGTNQYPQKESIPPLGDFITVRKDAPAIFFSFASPALLEALFGHEIAEQIVNEERKKWENTNKYYYFQKEDLQPLLAKNPIVASKYLALESYFDFSKQMQLRDEIGGIDKQTGLSIKKYL